MRIGIFGGSFDPIHTGHLMLAESARTEAGLDRLIILPAYESPFKVGQSNAGSEDRMQMAILAAEGNENMEVSSFDIDKGKVSFMVDLLMEMEEMFAPEDKFYFISGTDSILKIEKWKGSDILLTRYGFVVGSRPGYRTEELTQHVEHLRKTYGTDIRIVDIPQVDISSTDIRQRCRDGRTIKYLVPDKVEKYIIQHGLYK